jgi:hypothetical protein
LDWGFYLSGLIDADGSFTDISKNSANLTIAFHEKDLFLAYKIKHILQFGSVRKVKNKRAYILVLTGRSSFEKLATFLTSDSLQHKTKASRFRAICEFYKISIINSPS